MPLHRGAQSVISLLCLTAGLMGCAPATVPPRPPTASSLPAQGLDAAVRFFQQVISPVDGARSTMYPTGSAYARQALQKHGAVMGLVMTAERLLHEGNEEQVAPRIRKHGLLRVYDPVEANDWWWHGPAWYYIPDAEPGERRGNAWR